MLMSYDNKNYVITINIKLRVLFFFSDFFYVFLIEVKLCNQLLLICMFVKYLS